MSERITYSSLTFTEEDHAAYERALRDFRLEQAHSILVTGHEGIPRKRRKKYEVLEDRDPTNPSRIIARFLIPQAEDLELAVETAQSMVPHMKEMSWDRRLEILQRMKELILQRQFDLSALLTYEVGKPRGEARAEVLEIPAMVDACTDFLTRQDNYFWPMADGAEKPFEKTLVGMRPLGGPVLVIGPFNFPLALVANAAMAAFLMGNPIIIKASSDAPLAGLAWRNIMVDAGMPMDACLYVTGSGGDVGDRLVRNPGIAKIAFTGSKNVGQSISLTRTQMGLHNNVVAEMGGKNPTIVMESADIADAAEGVLRSVVGFSGQKCSAASRVYVMRSVMAEFLYALQNQELLAPWVVGDPALRETLVGPLVNGSAVEKYEHVLQGLPNDSMVETFPLFSRDETQGLERGHFVLPLAIVGVPHDHWVAREEHFVPIITVHPVDSLEEAVRKANDSEYGLTAGIFSEDEGEIEYFFENVDAGVKYSNRRDGATTGAWPTIQAFGGWKNSGIGGLQAFGPYYLLEFARGDTRTEAQWNRYGLSG